MKPGISRYTGWLLVVMLGGCGGTAMDSSSNAGPVPGAQETVPAASSEFLSDNEHWRQQRAEDLRKPDGWMHLAGLYWVRSKRHLIGSAPGNGMRLPFGPEHVGVLAEERPGQFFFLPENDLKSTHNGEPVTGRIRIYSDGDPEPSVIGFDDGKGVMRLIRRGNRYALRVWHADAGAQASSVPLEYWPADPGWRIRGRFIASPAGQTLPVTNIIGAVDDLPNPGVVEFQRGGKTYRLETIGTAGEQLSIVFADLTSGQGSYVTGRYVDLDPPDSEGNVVLDFNRAYSPPAAFTRYSTSLLAPASNRMDIAVTAGEKYQRPSSPQ
ncbi:MAG: DUF1684 domain-containing protein [Xanthomonadaceae bacterium]|nr:DUF1684 domain-containing protein [Xanthomonadaceae bacterium]